MKSNTERTSKTVGNILQVTKNTIQVNDNYYDYYINKDNSLYMKQIPLLVRKAKMQEIAIRKKENEKNNRDFDENKIKSQSSEKYLVPLNDIRNSQNRSKKLPPLCPFYSNKGELLRSVVTTSKIYNRQFLNDNASISPKKAIKILKIKCNSTTENTPGTQPVKINFDDFQNDFFYEPEYSSLVYKDSDIFNKREHYFELINNKINEFKIQDINTNGNEFKKEKIFEKNKQKKSIALTFNSLSVKIYDLPSEKKENGKNQEVQIFEYNLPFVYLPLFYYKGEEKFKILLSKIIQWDKANNKFILVENPEKIIKDILKNCVDFNKKEIKEEQKKKETHQAEEPAKPTKQKFNLTLGGKKTFKKDLSAFKFNPLATTISEEQNLAQTMANIPNMYLTNLDDNKKKYDIVSQSSIYPIQKAHNYINYNIFEFLWLTQDKNFIVRINTPVANITIPRNRIKVKKYIDFELLFYLYENNFKNWDFYFVKYLSSFKSFRTLIEDINAINESHNKDFYLTQPRIKNYSFNNTKIINIATIKQKDALENLIEGLMGIPEEKEENKNKNHGERFSKFKNSSKVDIIKVEKTEEKIITNEKEKKPGDDTAQKKEDNKNEEKVKNNNEQKPSEENEKEELINSTFIEKCFIAIIRFVDTKTFKANEFKIYFNFNQFQKFQKMEKYIDKISFLIKFIDINYTNKSVTIDYKSIDNFNEKAWIKDYNQYNTHYLKTLDNKQSNNNNNNNTNEHSKNSAEYIGMTRNSVIQIEVLTPISLNRTVNDSGFIKTQIKMLKSKNQNKAVKVKKDDILGMSRLFYNCFGEEQNNKKS